MHYYHGVFVYGPRPTYHRVYSNARPRNGRVQVQEQHMPVRKVDRNKSLAVGLRTGSYFSGYHDANGYADFGLGVTGRYRPAEAVGLELALSHHNQTFDNDTERAQTLTQGSVMLFATPWARVSPYVLGGVSYAARGIHDEIYDRDLGQVITANGHSPLYGLHGGAGIEFAVGKSLALDLEARYVGYVNNPGPDDPSLGGGLTTTAGFLVHF